MRKVSDKRRALVASLLLACVAVLTGKTVEDYSSPPDRQKNCDFTFPPGDDSKPTVLNLRQPRSSIVIADKGGFINDASCLNKTSVYGVVRIKTAEDARAALQFARDNRLKVSIAGQRHSMGGQALSHDGLILDMRDFSQITLDREHKLVRVQSGATWAQVQQVIDRAGLSVAAMQSINVFSIGGSISVNAHGIAHRPGPIASTVRSLRIMLANGEIKNASPTENVELFRHAIGGYGLFGLILDADLQLVDNEVYSLESHELDYKDFPAYYRSNVADDKDVGLVYGRISISPTSSEIDAFFAAKKQYDPDGLFTNKLYEKYGK